MKKKITEIIENAEYAIMETEYDAKNVDLTYDDDEYDLISEHQATLGELSNTIKELIEGESNEIEDDEKVNIYQTRMGSGEIVTWYVPESWN
jgi:hypothetical protein